MPLAELTRAAFRLSQDEISCIIAKYLRVIKLDATDKWVRSCPQRCAARLAAGLAVRFLDLDAERC